MDPDDKHKIELPGGEQQEERREDIHNKSKQSQRLYFTPRQGTDDSFSIRSVTTSSTERSIHGLYKSISTCSPHTFPALMKQLQKHIHNLLLEKKEMQEVFDISATKLNMMLEEKISKIAEVEKEKNSILSSAESSLLKLDSILASRMDTIRILEKKNNMLEDQLIQEREKYSQGVPTTARPSHSLLGTRGQEEHMQAMADLETQLRNLEVDYDKLIIEHKRLEECIAKEMSLREIAERYSRNNEEILNSHMLVVHNLELEVQDQKQQVNELKKEISSMHESNTREDKHRAHMENELQQTRHRVTELNKAISSSNMQLEKERLHNKNIEKSLHKSEAEISERIQLVDKLQIKIKSHLATISDLQMKVQELERDREMQTVKIANLECNLVQVQSSYTKSQSENLQLKKENKQIEMKLNDAQLIQSRCAGLEKSLQDEKDHSTDIARQLMKSMEAQVQLSDELFKASTKLDFLTEEQRLVQHRHTRSVDTISQLEQDNNGLRLKLQKLNSELQIALVKTSTDQSRHHELQQYLKIERDKNRTLSNDVEMWTKQTEDLRKMLEAERTTLWQTNLNQELIWKTTIEKKMQNWVDQ